MQDSASSHDRAVVVARRADDVPDTDEITALAEAAGYEVVDALTQRRREDGAYNVGEGKARELARRVGETGAGTVVFDDALTPGQYRDLTALLPDGTAVLDRHRIVLDIFGERTGDRAATLQVELAKRRYELPRVRATEERTHMQRAAETGSRVVDLERRIRTVERNLREVREAAAQRREDRRAEGFDLVAIAGYTNAGKSTLLHRLADDLSVDSHEPAHADLDGEAEVEDRLFKTLETTTRRATLAGRPVLATDTVGLVDGLPHDLVASFSTTLEAVADADVALFVVDASDDPAAVREKVAVSLAELEDPRGEVLGVLNKTDLVDDAGVAEREDVLREFDAVDAVLPVSAVEGDGVDRLRARIADALPTARATFDLPNDGDAQAFLAWAYDSGSVTDVTYEGDRVSLAFSGRPEVVAEAERRAPDHGPGAESARAGGEN